MTKEAESEGQAEKTACAHASAARGGVNRYLWLEHYSSAESIEKRISAPPGCKRAATTQSSFAEWLRGLPLKKDGTPVRLFNGKDKANQSVHVAVVDIDTGDRDLQQCADAVIRLRAEYLYASGKHEAIRFHFTSGDEASFAKWAEGFRPSVTGNRVEWKKTARPDSGYASFRRYLDNVFTYAGTVSLEREMIPVRNSADIRAGDVFIQGGSPGHTVIVVDTAFDDGGGKIFLLAQSFMPAQDVHILKNPANAELSPWYEAEFADSLVTPEWTFKGDALRRFAEPSTRAD
jgi:hypothetical protein